MLGTYKNPSNIENYINNIFKINKNSIVTNFLKQINDEQLKGESCRQYNFSFYLALYLVILVYNDVLKYPNKTWDYFVSKYNLLEHKKCLACTGINLETILTSFMLPPINTSGIEGVQIEQTLEVEPIDLTEPTIIVAPVKILDLIQSGKTCINNINLNC